MNKKIAAGIGLASIVAGLFIWKAFAPEPPAYREAVVTRGDLRVTITATGTVAPENRLEIKPPIAGRVEEVLIDEGMPVKKGDVLAWMSSSERATLLDAARARGPQELKRWEDFYKPAPILSPIDGSVISRNVEPGQSFTTADAIFVLSDRLTVKAQVDETDIAEIRLRQAAQIALDAYPKETFPAQVDQIAFDATTVNNVTTYVVDVLPENAPSFLRSGMTANVTFSVASKADALQAPLEAVKPSGGKATVLVPGKKGEGPAEKIIETGLNDGRQVEILSGLSEGDRLLIPQKKAAKNNAGTSPFSPVGRSRGGR